MLPVLLGRVSTTNKVAGGIHSLWWGRGLVAEVAKEPHAVKLALLGISCPGLCYSLGYLQTSDGTRLHTSAALWDGVEAALLLNSTVEARGGAAQGEFDPLPPRGHTWAEQLHTIRGSVTGMWRRGKRAGQRPGTSGDQDEPQAQARGWWAKWQHAGIPERPPKLFRPSGIPV